MGFNEGVVGEESGGGSSPQDDVGVVEIGRGGINGGEGDEEVDELAGDERVAGQAGGDQPRVEAPHLLWRAAGGERCQKRVADGDGLMG